MARRRGLICAIIRLPLEYNADRHGMRGPVEEAKYVETAKEIATRFGGGTLFRWEQGKPTGFWWGKGVLYDDDLAAMRSMCRIRRSREPGFGNMPGAFSWHDLSRRPSISSSWDRSNR